jgi:hypothetical protein
MRTFWIAKVQVGSGTDWAVVAADDDGSEVWLTRYPPEAEAVAIALGLTAAEGEEGDAQ